MRILIISALFLLANLSFGQARIDFTIEEIKDEIKNDNFETLEGYNKSGIKYLTVFYEEALFIYYFDSSNHKCFSVGITPKDQVNLKKYIEHYNKNFVIISSTKWKWYYKEGIINIELVFDKDLDPYFIWVKE